MTATPCPAPETLARFSEDLLSPDEAEPVREHAADCEQCRARLAALALHAETRESDGARRGWTSELLSPRRSLEPAGAEPPPLRSGDRLGRFEVERFIAEGGMGKVYAARDVDLGRPVALKLLRSGGPAEGDSGPHHARLLREAQAMARLSHPNVVTLYEVGEVGGRLFVAMELIEGGTLRAWLAGGRSVDAILDHFAAAGRGLAAAHAAGIVHRDFKPDNVLLGQDGRARVTDFGLARPLSAPPIAGEAPAAASPVSPLSSPTGSTPMPETALTPLGAFAGTPAYMAPEQLRGEPVDARADVFAFCAALHEGLYGRPPFPARTLYQLAQKIARGELAPAPPGSKVPPWLRRLLVRGLADAPADRFPSMEALLAELEAGRRRAALRRRLLPAGAALALLALAALAFQLWQARRRARLPAGRVPVAVVAPENRGEPADAWLGAALGELLASELAAGPRLRLIPPETVALMTGSGAQPAAAPRDVLLRLRQGLGARLVASGDYRRRGASIELSLRLWDTESFEPIGEAAGSGEPGKLAELVVRAGARLRRATGEDERSAAEAPVFGFPADPEAARLTALGLARFRVFDLPGALQNLEAAARRAPDNPRVLSALAEAQIFGGRDAQAKLSAQRALELSGGLPREQRLATELLLRRASNERDKAIELGRALWTFAPDDVEAGLRLARQYAWARREKEELEVVAELRKLPAPASEDPRVDLAESEAAGGAGDHRRSIAVARRAQEKARERGLPALQAFGAYLEGLGLRNAGESGPAREVLTKAVEQYRALGDRFGEARVETVLATVLADAGDLPGARALFERSAALYREMGDLAGEAVLFHNLGILLRRARELSASRAYLQSAAEVWEQLADRGGGSSTLAVLAHVSQDLGDLEQARVLYERSAQWRRELGSPLLPVSLAGLGEVRLQAGDVPEARRLCAEAEAAVKPGDQIRGATALLCTARVALAEGHEAQAASAAREAAARFAKTGQKDDGAGAEAVLVTALVSLRQGAGAREAAARAAGLIAGTKSELSRVDVAVAAARAAAAEGKPEPRTLETLRAALERARKSGVLEDQYEARLALGEIGARAGDPGAAKALQALAAEAQKSGHLWTARRAQRAGRRQVAAPRAPTRPTGPR